MPTKKNNIPKGGFIRKQDDANNPLLPFSAEKQRAYDAGEITLLELSSDDRNIKDMPYYQDRYDFNTTTKYYENQDKPTINPNTQRLINEIYYPESLQFGTATYATGLNKEKEDEVLDEIDKLRDDYYDSKITKADYEAKTDAYFDELERLNNEEIANYSFDPYKLGTPVKLDAEQARKNLKGAALDYFSSGDIYAIPVGDAYSTVYSRGAGGRPNSFQFLGADFTQGDGYAALNDYLFPGTDKLAQSYILSKDSVLGLEDMFGINPGTGFYSIDFRYPYEVTKEHIYLGNPTIEQIIDNPEKYKLQLDALTEQSRGPDTYLFSSDDFDDGATFQYVNVPPGQPVELRSLPFDKDSYTGPLIPPKVDDYEYMEWESRTNPSTGKYEKMPVGPKYPQSSNYIWGIPLALDKDSYIDRPVYPKGTKGQKLFLGDTYGNVNPNFTSSGGMTSEVGTFQQDDIFAIENYGGSRFNNILYSPEYTGYEVETTTATLKPELEKEMQTFEEELQKETERRSKIIDDNFLLQYIGMENLSDQSFRTSGGKEFTELVDNTGKSSQGKTLYYYEDDNGDLLYVAPMTRWGTQNNQAGEDQTFLKNFEQFTTKDGKLKKPKMISERDNPEKFRQFARNAMEWGFENAEGGTLPTFQGQSNPGGGIMRKDLMPTQENTIDMKEEGGFIRKQDVPSVVDLRYMPTDYMSGFDPNAMAQSGQTNNPRLFRGYATGFPLKAGTEGANPELYITAGGVQFSPQSLYRTGQAIMPSFGVRGDVAYDRSLTPEVREDIFRYTGRNISPFNTRFNPYIEVSGPRGNTVTGGVSFGGQVTPGGQSGLSYNVGYRKTFPVRKTKVTNQNLAEGGIFQNPITSAMNSFEEAGNLMIQNQLTDVLSQQIDDTFGFNFIPRDENGCEIKLMFKAQEGGYSMNQDNYANEFYNYLLGLGEKAKDFIEIYNNPNYVNQNQSFIGKAFDAYKIYSSGQLSGEERTPDPVKIDQDMTSDEINAANISSAIDKVAGENQDLRALLYTTAFMENSFGANPKAYGREYTHSFMSLDDPALNQIFDFKIDEKGEKLNRYTKGQKAIFNMFESLGLPTDKESFTELLDKDDPLASVAAARAYYATVPEALPASSDTEGLFNYFSKYYNRGGQGKYQTEDKAFERFKTGYSKLSSQYDFENGGTVPSEILVSPEGVFDPNYIPGKPVIVPTENGVITTEGVPMDLVAVSDSGEIKYLPRNSGTHQFKGKVITEYPADMFYAKDGGLADWFKEEWVRIDTEGNITGPCGTMKKGKATTRCLPKKKAQSLTKAERKATARKKVRGSKKGKQFVSNTKKAKVKKRDTKRYDDGGQAPLSESFVMIDVSKMDSPRESKAFTFADNLSQYSTATAASKALNVNDIRDFLKSEGYDVSLTDSETLSADELSALNTYMTGQQSVMLDGGELPHQTFTRVTGLPWPEAKLRGYTDGSYAGNIALQQRILEGKSLFKRPNNLPKERFSNREGLVEIDLGND